MRSIWVAEAESSKIFLLGYLRGSDGVPTLDVFSGETMTMPTHGVLAAGRIKKYGE